MNWDLKKYPVNVNEIEKNYPGISPGAPGISESAVVGNLVFLSGISDTPGKAGFETRMTGCLDKVGKALAEAGSSLRNMVKLTVFIKDIYVCPTIWHAMRSYFVKKAPSLLEDPPAVTVIPVDSFLDPDRMIELDVVAVLAPDMPGWEVKRYPVPASESSETDHESYSCISLLSESVSVGNLLFLSGMSGDHPGSDTVDPGDFEGQMDIAFDKILAAMDRSGSSASNIIKTLHLETWLESHAMPEGDTLVSYSPASDRLWKRELEHFEKYAPFLLDEFPASTFLKLPFNPIPDSLVQLEVTGVLNRYRPGWVVRKYPLYLGRRGFTRHIGEIKKYYSNTVAVGRLVFISGQTATDAVTGRVDAESFEDQLTVALHNLKNAVEETGSALEYLVKTNVLLSDSSKYGAMRDIEMDFYRKYAPALVNEPPASTLIQPRSLASNRMLVEIDGICLIPQVK